METAPAPLSGRSLFIIAGETSGDQLGAEVVQSLKKMSPSLRIIGAGGPALKAAGQEQCLDLVPHAVMGFIEVVKRYRKFKRFFDQLLQEVDNERPEAVMLIDYPGFNLRFAREVKRRHPEIKIIYYIAPMVWAWKPNRAYHMEKDVDLLLTIFPFEKDWFSRKTPTLKVEFTGHPVVDQAAALPARERETGTLALFPGSRQGEILKNLPVMLLAVKRLAAAGVFKHLLIASTHERTDAWIRDILTRHELSPLSVEIVTGQAQVVMQRAWAGIAVSGTVATECSVLGLPIVVIYRMNPLTYLMAKALVKLPYYAMVNILAEKEIVRELQHFDVTPARIAREIACLFQDIPARTSVCQGLSDVASSLGSPGAARRAAEAVLKTLEKAS